MYVHFLVLVGFPEGPRSLSHVPSLVLVGFGDRVRSLSHVASLLSRRVCDTPLGPSLNPNYEHNGALTEPANTRKSACAKPLGPSANPKSTKGVDMRQASP